GSDDAGPSEDTSGSDDAGTLRRDDIVVLETNLDDATPEVLGSLQTTLLDAGAYDVTVVPTTMKKARPGHLVKVICDPDDARRLARRLAAETGTLGVRATGASHRWIADRQFRTVTLEVGGDSVELSVKLASDDAGTVYDVSAEYDDALRVARATGVPVRELLRRAEARARVETEDDGEAN
ncbi:MAG: nickel insertion protein, partial [Halobaculum sp.]